MAPNARHPARSRTEHNINCRKTQTSKKRANSSIAEFEVSIECDNEWINFKGRPYIFEPEYTDEEL